MTDDRPTARADHFRLGLLFAIGSAFAFGMLRTRSQNR